MRILWISDSCNLYSGFGTQSLAILKHLARSNEVLQLGWFCNNELDYEGIAVKPLGNDYGDAKEIKKYYKEFNPDIVISLGDIQMVDKLVYQMEDYIFRSKWIHWLPIDGQPYPEVFHEQIQNIEHLVTISDFGYNLYKERVKTGLYKIYHGIDKTIFRPLENRDLIRAPIGLHNHFVCLMVAQNQWRKNLPLMLEAFAKFAKTKKNVDLIIHTKPLSGEKAQGWNIPKLISEHSLIGKARISAENIPPIKMNRLYNCANLLVSSTQGEGFGLPHVEAMMAGIPLLLPDYTTSREQIDEGTKQCGELIKIASFMTQPGVNIKRAVIDINDCAEKLEKYYEDWIHGEQMARHYGRQARSNAIRKYEINKITREWDSLIMNTAKWQRDTIIQSEDIAITMREL